MATHLVRILSQSGGIRVLGLARTLLSVADTQCLCVEDTQARCAGGRRWQFANILEPHPAQPSTHSHTPDIATLRYRGRTRGVSCGS